MNVPEGVSDPASERVIAFANVPALAAVEVKDFAAERVKVPAEAIVAVNVRKKRKAVARMPDDAMPPVNALPTDFASVPTLGIVPPFRAVPACAMTPEEPTVPASESDGIPDTGIVRGLICGCGGWRKIPISRVLQIRAW
mgnify:CR=1 FL=1